MNHTTQTKIKIGIKLIKNKNAEKYNYAYAYALFTRSIQYVRNNDCFVLVQVSQAMQVPRKRYSYLASKYKELQGLYLFLKDLMEVNVYRLANARKMPIKLALFLLNYVYGYAKKIKANQGK